MRYGKTVKPVLIAAALLLATVSAYPAATERGEAAKGLAVRAGKLITMDGDDRVLNGAVVLIRGKKIEAVGPDGEIKIPEGYRVIDARDRWVVPGLVDYHSHVAGDLSDLNDGVYLTNPGLRTVETLTPNNEYVKDARAGGVTSLLLIPGSGTNQTGFGTLCKSAGRTPEDIIIKAPGTLKIAQAGNPEWYWYGVGRSFMNWNTRITLLIAKAYHQAWCDYEEGKVTEKPDFNLAWHDFRGVFRREYGTSVHTQGYQLMQMTARMLNDEIGIWTVPDHCTFDGYKTAPLMAERGMVIVAGPRNIWFDRLDRRIFGIPAKYKEGGVEKVGTNTDAPVLPIEEHFFQATVACHMGWDDTYEALRGLTRTTAEAGLIDDRVGSIEKGKDADLAIFTGDPIDPRNHCEMTIIDGRVVYDTSCNDRRY